MTTSILSEVVWQPTALRVLRRALATNRVAHAYLFEGPDGVGKEKTAFALSQALLCPLRGALSGPRAPVDDACGACSSCRRVLLRPGEARPSHPDLVVLEKGLYEPASIGRRTQETQELSVDQVRALVLTRAPFPSHEGRATIFLIRRAEELSQSAANALLKTLEEPNAANHFILLTSVPGSLLPTVRSRTQRIRFGALPEHVVEQLLQRGGTPQARSESLAKLSGGSMARAERLAEAEEQGSNERFVAKALRAIADRHPALALELAEEAKKNKEHLPEQLGALAITLAEQGRAAASQKEGDVIPSTERFRLALAAMRHLRANASAQLTIEAMLFQMRRR